MANYGYRQYISFMRRYSKATASYAAVKDIERHERLLGYSDLSNNNKKTIAGVRQIYSGP